MIREASAPGRARLLVAHDDVARAFDVTGARETAPRSPLIPTERDVHDTLERSRAASVERALSALPGIARATVTLSLPLRDPLSGLAPTPARAVAVIEGTATEAHVRNVIVSSLDGLEPGRVAVRVESPRAASPAPRLARVGPFVVGARSAGPLRATLAGFLGSTAIVASVLAWSRLKRRA